MCWRDRRIGGRWFDVGRRCEDTMMMGTIGFEPTMMALEHGNRKSYRVSIYG